MIINGLEAILACIGVVHAWGRLLGNTFKNHREIIAILQTMEKGYLERRRGTLEKDWKFKLTPFKTEDKEKYRGYFSLDVTIDDGLKLVFYNKYLQIPESFPLATIEVIEDDHVEIKFDKKTWKVPHIILAMAYEAERGDPDEWNRGGPDHPIRDDRRFGG